jgi:hypothetical protein
MIYLHNILKQEKIYSKDSFEKYKTKLDSTSSPLKKLNGVDLEIDSENRIYDDVVCHENAILDVAKLNIENSKEIKFVNCIICGDMFISDRESKLTNVYLDNCIVLGKVKFSSIHAGDISTLYRLNCYRLEFDGCTLETLHITENLLFHLLILDSTISNLFVFSNDIDVVTVYKNRLNKIEFDYSQVELNNLNLSYERYQMLQGDFNPFNFDNLIDIDEVVKKNDLYMKTQTLSFLKENSSISNDRESLSKVLYLESVLYQNTKVSKLFVQLVGGFVKPVSFVILGLIVYFGCAIIYTLPISIFQVSEGIKPLNFYDALYYSGITFTTIGYGDITPVNITKIFSVVEGLLGIAITSSFIVSLVRKYID